MSTQIHDPIHGTVTITHIMKMIIDTPEFQRLRDLKQLGASYFVFPSATHTRFEHSIGVSHLAGKLMETLQKKQPFGGLALGINSICLGCQKIT